MRVFKRHDNYLVKIAGEMLNKEASVWYYDQGLPARAPYRGYPQLKHTDGVTVDTIRAAYGYVFVPMETKLDEFESALMDTLRRMEVNMAITDNRGSRIQITPLGALQTAKVGLHTNVKIKSEMVKNQLSTEGTGYGKKNNIKRAFVRDPERIPQARFVWIIQTIDKMDFSITSVAFNDAIARLACSVFYDADDISTFADNEQTFEFTRDHLRGAAQLHEVSVSLSVQTHPLLFELSEYWRTSSNINSRFRQPLRNLKTDHLYENTYQAIAHRIRPVELAANGAGEMSTNVCMKCRSTLWGDNYVFEGARYDVMCPLCVHTTNEKFAIELKHHEYYRVAFPWTDAQMIDACNVSDETKEVFRAALTRVEKVRNEGQGHTAYTLVGDDYVGFKDVNRFLFTAMVNDPALKDKKVIKVKLIKK